MWVCDHCNRFGEWESNPRHAERAGEQHDRDKHIGGEHNR